MRSVFLLRMQCMARTGHTRPVKRDIRMPVHECAPCQMARVRFPDSITPRDDICTPLAVIPQGFYVTYGRAKVAHGAVKPRNTGGGGAKPTGEVTSKGDTRWKYTNALRAHGR